MFLVEINTDTYRNPLLRIYLFFELHLTVPAFYYISTRIVRSFEPAQEILVTLLIT